MTLLLERSDFDDYRSVSQNIGTRLNAFITEAQQVDLRNFLGAEFFTDFINKMFATRTGTISGASTTITGVGTLFTSELTVGDYITVTISGARETREVTVIGGNTSLTIASAFSADPSAGAFTYNLEKYHELFVGLDYTYSGEVIKLEGLKPALVYFAYARLLLHNPVQVSRFGVEEKESGNSQGLDIQRIRAEQKDAKAVALNYLADAEAYLDANNTTFTFWEGRGKLNKTAFKLTRI